MAVPQFSGGIFTPVQTGRDGGFRLLSGDDYITQLIRNLCGDVDSDNPFLEEGLGAKAIFSNLSDPGWQAVQIRRVKDIFSQLQNAQIAKLKSVKIAPSPDKPGVAQMQIRFLSIESATEIMVETSAPRT